MDITITIHNQTEEQIIEILDGLTLKDIEYTEEKQK